MGPTDAAALLARHRDPAPHGRLLSNGRYGVLLTNDGTGASTRDGVALTAWRGDRVADGDGIFVWLRDAETGRFASLGRRPGGADDARRSAAAAPGRMVLTCAWEGLEARLEACVAPDADVELRRLALRNASARPRRVEVAAVAELVLAPPAAHAAHPAFSKLFVETARAEAPGGLGALLARRRPRGTDEAPRWAAGAWAGPGALTFDTDRARALGRGRSWARPRLLIEPDALTGRTGAVLDPVFAWRARFELAPGAEAVGCLALACADGREDTLAALARAADPAAVAAAFAGAEARERALCGRLGLDDAAADALHALAVAARYGHPGLRASDAILRRSRGAREALAGQGIDPRRLVTALLGGPGSSARARELGRALAFWQAQGTSFTAVVLAEAPEVVAAALPREVAGSVRVRALRDVPPAERDLLLAAACLALPEGGLPEPARLAAPGGDAADPEPRARPLDPARDREPPPPAAGPRLANGFGRFAEDGDEYAVTLDPGPDGAPILPPMPWCNVLANERAGVLVSERGSACSWAENSRENRLTPWSNDPIADPCDEALWLRDDDLGVFWSPLPGPTPAPGRYEVRHGLGYSVWRHEGRGLRHEVVRFVPLGDAPVTLTRIRIIHAGTAAHAGTAPRRLSLFAFARLVLGGIPEDHGRFVVTARDTEAALLLAESHLDPGFGSGIAFSAAVAAAAAGPLRFTADRAAFLGRGGSAERPAAIASGTPLDGALGAGLDPCFAWELPLALAPGGATEVWLIAGQGRDGDEARALVRRFAAPGAGEAALDAVRGEGRALADALRVETPSRVLDPLVNGWLLHQTLACRLRGRTAFYQSGGAYGFRDQLQDAAALVRVRPELLRRQLLRHAAHQFEEGDVLHWWHPPVSKGMRTRFADDLAWLPYVAASYVEQTGDAAVLDEPVRWLRARMLAPGEDEVFLAPEPGPERSPLWAHCCRALERAMTLGVHGIPLMGTGDWNDGMNRVGREGRGESVWMAFFLHHVIDGLAPLAERRGEHARAAAWRRYQAQVRDAVERHAWDGRWYRRAWYDDGTPLGTAAGDECRIDALVQAWAVISGAAPRARAEQAMESVVRELVDEEAGLIRLLAPPFDRTAHDPGYIKGYVPGIRENGGQYTHAALWVVRALAELGRRDDAARLLERLAPSWHTRDAAALAVYQTEPYAIAADVYGTPPHVGRGGWTWYTGSAAWMLRVVHESLLGLHLEADAEGRRSLVLRPRIPDAWPAVTVSWRLPPDGATTLRIRLVNPAGRAATVTACRLDGRPVPVRDGAARVSLPGDGRPHELVATLG